MPAHIWYMRLVLTMHQHIHTLPIPTFMVLTSHTHSFEYNRPMTKHPFSPNTLTWLADTLLSFPHKNYTHLTSLTLILSSESLLWQCHSLKVWAIIVIIVTTKNAKEKDYNRVRERDREEYKRRERTHLNSNKSHWLDNILFSCLNYLPPTIFKNPSMGHDQSDQMVK